METKFYKIKSKKSGKFITRYGKDIWYPTEIDDLKSVIKQRASIKGYNFSDFIVLEFVVLETNNKFYFIKDNLVDYTENKDLIEGLYE